MYTPILDTRQSAYKQNRIHAERKSATTIPYTYIYNLFNTLKAKIMSI